MYSPSHVQDGSHTMNKQTPLDTLVQTLTNALSTPVPTGSRKRKRQSKSQASKKQARLSRNPGVRNQIASRDNQLDLTRAQFTATSPLNLFTVNRGSTPGGIRVQGRELIAAVSPTGTLAGAFTQLNVPVGVGFLLNPANFPRLSAYAPIYEFYKFHKCDILFQANQPTTAIGEILLAVDYDAKDAAPTTAVGMMRNISSTMANIYSDASLQILGSLSRLPKFVTAEGTGSDADQVNQASLWVAAEGVTATAGATLGYVIAQYDIEFYTPQ